MPPKSVSIQPDLSTALILDAQDGLVVGAPPADRLWLRGSGPTQAIWPWPKSEFAPRNGGPPPDDYAPVYEVWGVGYGRTRSFQIHPPDILTDSETKWLKTCPVPIYTLKDERAVNRQSVVYPYARVRELAGPGPYCSSFDHMLSLAIAEGFTDIGLSGVDLQVGTPRERLMEHVSLAYWLGVAMGLGITIRNAGLTLRFPYTYGKDYQKERTFGQRMGFWAAMGMLNFQFDDGQAATAPQGWRYGFSTKRVHVSI